MVQKILYKFDYTIPTHVVDLKIKKKRFTKQIYNLNSLRNIIPIKYYSYYQFILTI